MSYRFQPIELRNIDKTLMGMYIEFNKSIITDTSYFKELRNLWQDFMQNSYSKLKRWYVDDMIIAIEENRDNKQIRKWAAAEIRDESNINLLANNHIITLHGIYYGFIHTGTASQFSDSLLMAYQYLATNKMNVDMSRPRFEVMSNHYLPDDPNAQEECWIPIMS